MADFDLKRRAVTEALGVATLVAAVVGSGIMADRLTDDIGLALLCNALATGTILIVLISVFGPISGAHFNPAVSLVAALRGEMKWYELAVYILAQVIGAVVGTMLAHAMFAMALLQIGSAVRTGASLWLSEAIATAGLILVILSGLKFERLSVSWLVGLYITSAYWFTSSTSFANPAVTLARTLTTSFTGIRPLDSPAFIFAQLAGAVSAWLLAGWLMRENSERKAIS